MRTITVSLSMDGKPRSHIDETPAFETFEAWGDEPLERVRLHQIERRGEIDLQLVEIAAGGRFAMHSSPKLSFCQVVHGTGQLGLPDGSSVAYRGPETFIFHPDTLHDWHDVSEGTLLAVAIVPDDA